MKQQSVTIREVARHAGVSVGTVSRVLNGAMNIGDENLRRVRAAMEKLDYRTCDSARLLASRRAGSRKRTGNIGVLLSGMGSAWADHPLFAAYTNGVAAACDEHGYHPLLEFADEGGAGDMPRFLTGQKADGMLIKGVTPPPAWLTSVAETLPVVGMSMHEPGLAIPQVMPDNRAAGWQMAQYLWGRGHRRIAYVCNDAHHRMFLHRMQGVQEFLRLQRSYDPKLIAVEDPADDLQASRPEASLPQMDRFVDRLWSLPADQRPTAIVAANDWHAAGLFLSLEKKGLSVPQDVSLVGFDNVPAVCCSVRSPLTSYEVPLRQVGYVAAKILLRRIEAPEEYVSSGIQLIAGELVERDSVATIAADDRQNACPA